MKFKRKHYSSWIIFIFMELEFILIFIHVKRNTNIHVYMLRGGGTEIVSSELIKIFHD